MYINIFNGEFSGWHGRYGKVGASGSDRLRDGEAISIADDAAALSLADRWVWWEWVTK